MKLMMFQGGDGDAVLGALTAGGVVSIGGPDDRDVPTDMVGFIEAGPEVWAHAREELSSANREPFALDVINIVAPIARPARDVFCVEVNYPGYGAEVARMSGHDAALPEAPQLTVRLPESVTGPGAISIEPSISRQIDWGVQLAVVIGVGGRDIPASRALEHVFGYTICNGVVARDVAARHGAGSFKSTSFDTFSPIGPWIVTADELPNPGALGLRLLVNGVEKQDSNTRELIFDVPSVIESLSAGLLLQPGDIVLTGTPDGVGFARNPAEFLKDGDIVECEIDGIGVLRNPVFARP
jgi:2-keto-4-pentenoate hydratase/2-oxohepta-3-ene-1,7-dioic acid hydratase in catechol pathway